MTTAVAEPSATKTISPSKKKAQTLHYARTCCRPLTVLLKMADTLKLSNEETGALARLFQAEIAKRIESKSTPEPFLDTCMSAALANVVAKAAEQQTA